MPTLEICCNAAHKSLRDDGVTGKKTGKNRLRSGKRSVVLHLVNYWALLEPLKGDATAL